MADFTVTGDTSSAVASVLALRKALGMASEQLRNANGTLKSYQSSLEQTVAAQARAQIASAQKTRLIENERRAILGLMSVEKEQAATAAANLNKMVATQQRANRQANHFLLTWKSIYRLVSVQALHLAIGRLVSVVFQATRALVDLQIKISEIRTISLQAQYSFDTWRRSVQALSAEFGRTALDVAEGAYQTLSNQVAKGAEVFRFMGDALIFSRTAATTTANAVNLLTSVINAFGMKTTDATEIAAVFMKTVELGRVRVEDLANTFGRISPSAVGLGITLQELGALLSGLTKTGLPVDEAMTGMNQVMLKLTIPSKKLTAIMREWGYESGRSAIAAMGFTGVLMRLEKEAAASADKMEFLGEVFRRVRAVRAGAAIFNPAFLAKYRSELDQITNSLGDYAKQSKIAFEKENTSVRIQQMTEQFKNYLAENISKPMLDLLVKLGGDDGFVGMFLKLRGAIEGILAPVITLVGAMTKIGMSVRQWIFLIGTLKFAWMAYSRRVISDAQGQVRIQKLFGMEIVRSTHNADALATKFRLVGLAIHTGLTVGLSLLSMFIFEEISARKEAELLASQQQEALADWVRSHRRAKGEVSSLEKQNHQDRMRMFKEVLSTQNKIYLEATAIAQRFINRVEDMFSEMASNAAEATKRAWADVENQMTSAISNLKKMATDAKRARDDIKKELTAAPHMAKLAAYDSAMVENKDRPLVQLEMAAKHSTYLETMLDKAKETLSKDLSYDNYKNVLKAYDELSDQTKERIQLAEQLQNSNQTSLREEKLAAAEQVKALEKINALMAERVRYLDQLSPKLAAKAEAVEKEAEAQKKIQRDAKATFTLLQKKIGTKPANAEIAKTREDTIKKLEATLTSQISKFTDDDVKAQFKKLLEEQLALLVTEKKIAKTREHLATVQKEVRAKIDAAEKKANELSHAEQKAQDAPKAVTKMVQEIFGKLTSSLPGARSAGNFKFENATGGKIQGQLFDRLSQSFRSNPLFAQALTYKDTRGSQLQKTKTLEGLDLAKLIKPFGLLQKEMDAAKTADLKADAAKKMVKIIEFWQQAITEVEKISGGGKKFAGNDGGSYFKDGKFVGNKRTDELYQPTTGDALSAITEALKEVISAPGRIKSASQAQADLQRAVEQSQTHAENLRDQLSGLVGSNTTTIEAQLKLIGTIEELMGEIRKLITKMPGTGHATGGLIAGGIPNKDSVMSMLMPGEFVINSKAARNNLAMLDAINRGGQLPGFSVGGMLASSRSNSQNTSIGDINIVVNGGPTNQDTVRELGIALRREIRKGTVSLS